jgi:hypothetical protein
MTLIEILDDELTADGFRRFGTRWIRGAENFYEVFQIQKSAYGRTSHVNSGICLKSKPINKIGYDDIMIAGRLGQLKSSDPKLMRLYSNGYSRESVGFEEEADLRMSVREMLMHFANHLASLDSIRKAMSSGIISPGSVRRDLSVLLVKDQTAS